MIFHSIRWRILAWNFVLLAVVVSVLLLAFHRIERISRLQDIDLRLRQGMSRAMGPLSEIAPDVALPRAATEPRPGARPRAGDTPAGRAARAEENIRDIEAGGLWIVGATREGRVAYRSSHAPAGEALLGAVSQELQFADELAVGSARPQDIVLSALGHRILVHRPPGGAFIAFGLETASVEGALRSLGWQLVWLGLAIVSVGCSVGWALAGRSLRPLGRIAADAEGIAAGDYDRKIDLADTESELGSLAVVLNDTFARMNAAREQVAQFTADASHELRTPLTVILSESQNALRQERNPAEYRAALETVKQSALRMKAISDALLELAHGDAGRPVPQDACDVADLADESVALLGRLAREHGATLVAQLESAPVRGDAGRLGRLVLNLVMNAVLHNGAGVRVVVTTGVVGDKAQLTVSDDGRGISPEHLARIFERFHRADISRSRHTGGAGLGLAIVRQTVEAHGGVVTVSSRLGEGTTFTVLLPKA